MSPSIRFYGHPISGHAHRVAAFLSILGLPHERIVVDLANGEHKSPAFLAKNPLGQIPVLEDGEITIADSTAILVYLAHRYDPSDRWLPWNPVAAAEVQRWLSVASGELANGPALARLHGVLGRPIDYAKAKSTAEALLAMLDAHLERRQVLVGDEATIADLAMYAYTARAPEGGISLAPWPAVRAWLARIESIPGFVPMVQSASRFS